MGSAQWKRSRFLPAGGPGQAAPGAVVPAVPGAMRLTATRRDWWQIAIAVAGLLSGVGVAWIVNRGGPGRIGVPNLPFAVPVVVLVGWSFIGAGLLYWRSRPDNRLWAVLIFQGFAWFAAMLADSHNPALFTFGEAVYPFQYASGLYLVLSFPSGRLQGRLDRALVALAIFLVTVANWMWMLFADPHHSMCRNCPANLLEVTRDDAAVAGVFYVLRVGGIVIALTGIGLLGGRWVRATRAQRHAVMPVAVAGAVAFVAVILAYVARVAGMSSPNAFDALFFYAAAAIPVAALGVLIQRRLAHGAVAGLVVELGGPGSAVDPAEALSRALGDPSLALGYWFAAESRYVDRSGGAVELPAASSGRRSTVVERGGQPVAVLIHDVALEHTAGCPSRSRPRPTTSSARHSPTRPSTRRPERSAWPPVAPAAS